MSFLDDKCPVNKQIDNIDETIKELNERIGKLIQKQNISIKKLNFIKT